jgi:hypothetical protein
VFGHFKVVSPFEATEPLSGSKRHFVPGEVFTIDLDTRDDPNVTIALDKSYFVVDQHTFDSCCERFAHRDGSVLDLDS